MLPLTRAQVRHDLWIHPPGVRTSAPNHPLSIDLPYPPCIGRSAHVVLALYCVLSLEVSLILLSPD